MNILVDLHTFAAVYVPKWVPSFRKYVHLETVNITQHK